ncbi:MAG: 5'-deoxynucleotidase [Oscillospiraceae bacterium]|nr:5'-deoxynucleotidase [Oscillospiraceae bacterium]
MDYSFYALVSRMKNINRWALMRNSYPENVQEHSHMVAVLAHALCVIRRDVFGIPTDPGAAVSAALFHDASEILTGDLPTPIKYHDPEIMTAYKQVEQQAAKKLVSSLPPEMRDAYEQVLTPADPDVAAIVKAADRLSAYIKCVEELKAGNNEFRSASEQTMRKLRAIDRPEVTYFIENFLPAFELTLDELNLD